MADLTDRITLEINADDLLAQLEGVQIEAEKTEDIVEEVKEASETSFTEVMSMVHAGWLATQGIVRAAGGSIQTVFRTLVGTTLGTISVLKPLFTAKAAAGDWISAAIGFASIGLSLAALSAAESQQKEISDQLRGANMALHGVQSLIGNIGGLW
jgi:hypothetical protein